MECARAPVSSFNYDWRLMHNRRYHRSTLWLLPLLLWRLLLPAGVMPASGHQAGLVMCSGHGALAAESGVKPDTPDSRSGGKPAQHTCPFAMVGAFAPLSASYMHADIIESATRTVAVPDAQRIAPSGPQRKHLSRGPPELS